MGSKGTPLRKFGRYRVRRISNRRDPPLYVLVDERDGTDVLTSYCVGALNWIGERLGSGKMAASPREVEAASVDVLPSMHASRFEHCQRKWADSFYGCWINGGPIDENFDWITPDGASYHKVRIEMEDAASAARLGLTSTDDEYNARGRLVRAQYAVGEWPDAVDGRTGLFNDTDRSMMASLLVADVSPVWVDAGREAMRLLLRHGVNDSALESHMSFVASSGTHRLCGTRERLVVLAEKLAAKYGGEWSE